MQNFTDINESQTLTESRSLLLENDKTNRSNASGPVFPTTNLQVGMFCIRTDQNKLYRLHDTTPTWVMVLDLSKTVIYSDSQAANSALLAGLPVSNPATPGQGPLWGSIPKIHTDGVMEIGRYIDFHGASSDAVNSTVRLDGGGAGSTTLNLTGTFVATGDVTAFSDERLKKDWKPFGPGFTEKLAKVKYGTFTRIDLKTRQVGVGARSLRELLPEAVLKGEDKDGTLSVAYGNTALAICVHLAEEIVGLKAKIEALQA